MDLGSGPTEQLCIKLATNARDALNSDWSVSESGVCGPSRPDKYRAEIKGPGYCAIAVVGPQGHVKSKTIDSGLAGPHDRAANMCAFAEALLECLLESLRETAAGPAKS